VEVRNSAAKDPIGNRDSATLVEDLCLALRDVAVWDNDLPNGLSVLKHVRSVQAISTELSLRKIEIASRIQELSAQTNWQMETLLKDCLAYPSTMPYVREKDGVRRRFRCGLCGTNEFPDQTEIVMCNKCLETTLRAIQCREHVPGLFLYRTYTPSKRCEHADSETVLATLILDEDFPFDDGRCPICYAEEQGRRRDREATGSISG